MSAAEETNPDRSTTIRYKPDFSIGAIIGTVVGLIAIAGAVVGTPLWVVEKVKAGNDELKTELTQEMAKAVESHEEHTHAGSVTKEVYQAHVKRTDERHAEQRESLKEIKESNADINRKLDALGRQVYANEREWLRASGGK